MPYSSSYSSSTGSGVATGSSSGNGSSSSSTTVGTSIQTSSPDDSDGLSAELAGVAIASGEDTLTAGSISAEMVDEGAATSLSGAVTMLAASEASDETAFALAETYAEVDGAEMVATYTIGTESRQQDATGSAATSTSTTHIAASDINLSEAGDNDDSSGDDIPAGADSPGGDESPDSSLAASDLDRGWDLDGNIATIEFEALAVGDGTFISGDFFVLADDQLSTSAGVVVLGVD